MEAKPNRKNVINGIKEYIDKVLDESFTIDYTQTKGTDISILAQKFKNDQWTLLSTGIVPIGHIGISSGWIPLLSKAILHLDQQATGEVAEDLIKEFVGKMVYEQLPEHIKGDKAHKDLLSVVKITQLEKSLANASFDLLDFRVRDVRVENGESKEASLFLILFETKELKQKLVSSAAKSLIDEASMAEKAAEIGNKVEFEEFNRETMIKNDFEVRNIQILKDVEMNLSVELGKQEMPLGDILKLVKGSVIELNKMAGEPVEILVNGYRIALGEVVVIDEHFGVRVTSLVSEHERMKSLV